VSASDLTITNEPRSREDFIIIIIIIIIIISLKAFVGPLAVFQFVNPT
jgi:hypothetical protein